jgi:dethiobiotin synthetase
MTVFFMTGAGTDIGKTWIGAALLRHWRDAGLEPAAIKPVASGYDRREPRDSDGATLLTALGQLPDTPRIEAITPVRLRAPLSPDQAAAREGVALSAAGLAQACAPLIAAARGPVLIEGAGGVMSPLNADETMLDLAAALGAPCLFVCGTYLGALSHALTGLAALKARGLAVPLLLVNETPDIGLDIADTVASLTPHVGDSAVLPVTRFCDDSVWEQASRILGVL